MRTKGFSSELYEAAFGIDAPAEPVDWSSRCISAQRVKTVMAGDMLYVSAFPIWASVNDLRAARGYKPTRQAQIKLNQRNRRLRFEQTAHANFGRKDLYFTATYSPRPRFGEKVSYEGEPEDAKEAQKNWRRFVERMHKLAKKKGSVENLLRYMAVIDGSESTAADPDEARVKWHHHALISRVIGRAADGTEITITRDEVEDLWQSMFHAERTRCDWIQPNDKGISEVAQYLVRQENGMREGPDGRKRLIRYSASKNLKKPVEKRSDRALSRRRARLAAEDCRVTGKEIMEKLYPGYKVVPNDKGEAVTVHYSDICAGVYMFCRMIRRE